MKTITMVGTRAGLGNTTALLRLAERLIQHGSVFVLGMNVQNPGIQFFGRIHEQKFQSGLVDLLVELQKERQRQRGIEALKGAIGASVSRSVRNCAMGNLLAEGSANARSYLKKAIELDLSTFFSHDNEFGSIVFQALKNVIREKYCPDYLLIDGGSGLSDLVAIASVQLADQVVLSHGLDKASISLAVMMRKAFLRCHKKYRSASIQLTVVAAMVPCGNETTRSVVTKAIRRSGGEFWSPDIIVPLYPPLLGDEGITPNPIFADRVDLDLAYNAIKGSVIDAPA